MITITTAMPSTKIALINLILKRREVLLRKAVAFVRSTISVAGGGSDGCTTWFTARSLDQQSRNLAELSSRSALTALTKRGVVCTIYLTRYPKHFTLRAVRMAPEKADVVPREERLGHAD